MSDSVITVENLSKAYLLGRQDKSDTFFGSIASSIKSPLKNLRQLRRLNTFDLNQADEGDEDILWALRDVSFEVKQGEVLGIIGRNGAGKSTLLKILSRITQLTHGRVEMRGRVSALLEVGTGFHPELSGRENIYMNGTILGMRKAEIDSKFDEIVDFSGVERFLDTPVKRYSSGMKVRLAFAVAAHLEPEILIVDEVLAVGDAEFQKKCLGKMQDVATGQGRTVLFVSHNLRAMASLCSRSILLGGGLLKSDGAPADIISYYQALEATKETETSYVETIINKELPAQILSVWLENVKGEKCTNFGVHEPYFLAMSYDVREAFDDFVTTFQIFTGLDELLMVTFDVDEGNTTKETLLSSQPRSPGRYLCRVKMPSPFLNGGLYSLQGNILKNVALGGAIQYKHVVIDSLKLPRFSIDDTNTFASHVFKRTRGGHLAIPLQWEVSER